VDDFLISKGATGWSRASSRGYADSLRAFFRYAEQRVRCMSDIAEGITSPKLYVHEGLPEGPAWSQVQRLFRTVRGTKAAAVRARAVLYLLAVYGLRSGKICFIPARDSEVRHNEYLHRFQDHSGLRDCVVDVRDC
jgi:site-specific recombinase XerD